jgi:hypothetical protein
MIPFDSEEYKKRNGEQNSNALVFLVPTFYENAWFNWTQKTNV